MSNLWIQFFRRMLNATGSFYPGRSRWLVTSAWLLCIPALFVLVLALIEYSIAGAASLLYRDPTHAPFSSAIAHAICYIGYYCWFVSVPTVFVGFIASIGVLFSHIPTKPKWMTLGVAILALTGVVIYMPLIGPYGCP